MPGPGGLCSWGGAWSGWGVSARGGLLREGGCVPGLGGVCSGEVCLLPGGCLVETPGTATAAGGTHPTGMHSCYSCKSTFQ